MAQLNTRVVLRNDTAGNWSAADANSDLVLMKGEIGIEFDPAGKVKMKVGDGTTNWSALSYFGGEESKVYQVDSFDELPTEDVAIGDTGIVKTLISEGKYSYTGYVYTEQGWAAMDGNYNASNVYFDKDFTFTEKIGTVKTLSNGSAIVSAEGKSVQEFFAGLFAAEQNPSKTEPSVSITLTGAGAKEVGTVVSPSYSATFNDGSYTYGPEPTGATVTTWKITNSATPDSLATPSGSLANVTVVDGINYTVSATVTYSEGLPGKTNLGNDSTVKIAAGTKSATSSAITGFRYAFYGSKTSPVALESANIRQLAKEKSTAGSLSVSIVEGAKQVIIAVPDGRKITKVEDTGAFGTDIIGSFVLNEGVPVGGADATADNIGSHSKNYNVYVYAPAAALGANTYKVTLANE